VDNAIASSHQETLRPQQLRLSLLAKSEHAPLAYPTAEGNPSAFTQSSGPEAMLGTPGTFAATGTVAPELITPPWGWRPGPPHGY
jgi:hypothetical protein